MEPIAAVNLPRVEEHLSQILTEADHAIPEVTSHRRDLLAQIIALPITGEVVEAVTEVVAVEVVEEVAVDLKFAVDVISVTQTKTPPINPWATINGILPMTILLTNPPGTVFLSAEDAVPTEIAPIGNLISIMDFRIYEFRTLPTKQDFQ